MAFTYRTTATFVEVLTVTAALGRVTMHNAEALVTTSSLGRVTAHSLEAILSVAVAAPKRRTTFMFFNMTS